MKNLFPGPVEYFLEFFAQGNDFQLIGAFVLGKVNPVNFFQGIHEESLGAQQVVEAECHGQEQVGIAAWVLVWVGDGMVQQFEGCMDLADEVIVFYGFFGIRNIGLDAFFHGLEGAEFIEQQVVLFVGVDGQLAQGMQKFERRGVDAGGVKTKGEVVFRIEGEAAEFQVVVVFHQAAQKTYVQVFDAGNFALGSHQIGCCAAGDALGALPEFEADNAAVIVIPPDVVHGVVAQVGKKFAVSIDMPVLVEQFDRTVPGGQLGLGFVRVGITPERDIRQGR
ncbi:MAG: hypothetical protein IPH12_02155 [Saprospirales bacterium]|nr:hypothetical protein [Saprospirales bacterium]